MGLLENQNINSTLNYLKGLNTQNEQAFSKLPGSIFPKSSKRKSLLGPMSVAPGQMSTPLMSLAPGLGGGSNRGLTAEQANQLAQQKASGFSFKQPRRSSKPAPRQTARPEPTRPAFESGTTYDKVVRKLGPVGAAAAGVSPQSDAGRMLRSERNLALEQENLRKLLQTPGQLGIAPGTDVKSLPAAKQQLIREAVNMATYGTPTPKFPGDVTATSKPETETAPVDTTAKEPVVSGAELERMQREAATGGLDVGGTQPFDYEREYVNYESFYPEFEKLSLEMLQNEINRINFSTDKRIAEQQQKDAQTKASAQAFFGASGGNKYGMSVNELQYLNKLDEQARKNAEELERARQMDILNATLGIQSNLLQAKIDDIEKKRQTDMFNIESGIRQAANAANIQKTLTDIDRIRTDMANIDRDEAQQVISEAFRNVGPGAFRGLDESELSSLEKKAGYPSGFLSNVNKMMQEAANDVEYDWKFSTDEKGNVSAYTYDPRSGEFLIKDIGKVGAAQKWASVPAKKYSAGKSLKPDEVEALRAYMSVTGQLPKDKQDQENIVKLWNTSKEGRLQTPLPEEVFGSLAKKEEEPQGVYEAKNIPLGLQSDIVDDLLAYEAGEVDSLDTIKRAYPEVSPTYIDQLAISYGIK